VVGIISILIIKRITIPALKYLPIYIFNAYASIHLSIQKEICTEFEVNYHCIPIPNLFPTLRKAEDMARNYSEEAKEILSDLLPKEGSEAKEILSDLIPPES